MFILQIDPKMQTAAGSTCDVRISLSCSERNQTGSKRGRLLVLVVCSCDSVKIDVRAGEEGK